MLEDLPILAFERMCEYLATDDDKLRRSIQALSLTSKACNAASARERLRSVSIHLTFQEGKFQKDLASLNALLCAGSNQRYVRRIKVDGYLLRAFGDEGYMETMEEKPTEATWQPLQKVLLACQGLTDLIWGTTHRVPRSLLDALQLHPRRPRLHVEKFQMWSLCQKRDRLQEVDPEDYALLSCNNLYRISTVSEGLTSDGLIDYQGEAVLEIVEQLAPNLEKVDIHYRLAGNSPQLLEAIRSERPTWKGFFRGNKPETVVQSKGKLKKLAIHGSSGLFLERLQCWLRSTDFSVLECLQLRSSIYVEAFEALIDVARSGVLTNLRQLSITGPIRTSDETLGQTLFERLLLFLNPLEALTFKEAVSLSAFATSKMFLRKLDIAVQFSLEQLVKLQEAFPCIEDLRICLQRTQGDEQELARYETLGSFPRMTRLTLLMDYSIAAATTDPKFATPREFQLYAMQSSLRNCAMDKTLATQIFTVILHANRKARPCVIPTFTSLEILCNSTSFQWHNDDFDPFRRRVALEWLCERRYADVHSDDVWVTELGEERRWWDLDLLKDYLTEDFKHCVDGELFWPAWEANWPSAKGEVKWFNTWHSFPLQV